MKKPVNHSLPRGEEVRPEILLELDYYTEGPVVDPAGNIYFTDLAGQSIYRLKKGKLSVWSKCKRPNGQALLKNGDHLICDSMEPAILRFDTQGNFKDFPAKGNIKGMEIRCPNDIAVDQNHGFYFTDSVRHTGAVFYVGFDGKQTAVAGNIDYANGIVIRPDSRYLLVAESYKNRILSIELERPGNPAGRPKVFATLPFNTQNPKSGNLPDGLALDAKGRLWVAHYGMQAVQVLSPSGQLLATFDTGIPLTSNLCFSKKGLIVTGGKSEPGPGYLALLNVGVQGQEL